MANNNNNSPYVLHSTERNAPLGDEASASLNSNFRSGGSSIQPNRQSYNYGSAEKGKYESALTHPWRKYCGHRYNFLSRLIPLLIPTIACLIVVVSLDGKMKVGSGIYQRTKVSGYSSLELAGSYSRAYYILEAWSPTQRLVAAFSAGFHFLFLFLYPSVVTMLCCWGANHSPFILLGDIIAWLQLIGAGADLILQSVLAFQIIHGTRHGLPELALAMDIIHLITLCVGFLYFLVTRIGHWFIWSHISRITPLELIDANDKYNVYL